MVPLDAPPGLVQCRRCRYEGPITIIQSIRSSLCASVALIHHQHAISIDRSGCKRETGTMRFNTLLVFALFLASSQVSTIRALNLWFQLAGSPMYGRLCLLTSVFCFRVRAGSS